VLAVIVEPVRDEYPSDDTVVVDTTVKELALNVEYAATPGVPLLILDTVRVDKARLLEVIVVAERVDPVSVE